MRKLVLIFGVGAVVFLAACKKASKTPTFDSGAKDTGGGGEESPAPVTASKEPLALQISTKYDETSTIVDYLFTETGTATCEATDAIPVVTCSITVPEARLFFSTVNFKFSWKNDKCKLLTFNPYYYRASVAASYVPLGSKTGVNCSGSPDAPDKGCFNGAATQVIPGFPQFTGLIYFPDESSPGAYQSKTESLPSAYSLAQPLMNRLAVNDLPSAKWGTGFTSAQMGSRGDGYVANSFVTYNWSCRDDWYDPLTYQITLRISDEDSTVGVTPVNHMVTWSAVP